jgi:hypothetical protein
MIYSTGSGIDENYIRAELKRVLDHRDFPKRGEIPKILSYIVEKSLNNEADSIKGYTIMVEALGKESERAENALRVQMKRLRDSLDRVYSNSWDDCEVRIILNPQSYVPIYRKMHYDRIRNHAHKDNIGFYNNKKSEIALVIFYSIASLSAMIYLYMNFR